MDPTPPPNSRIFLKFVECLMVFIGIVNIFYMQVFLPLSFTRNLLRFKNTVFEQSGPALVILHLSASHLTP